jgi:hypothetical protein
MRRIDEMDSEDELDISHSTEETADIGLIYLAILMHKAGVDKLVLTSAEADAMLEYADVNNVSLVVHAHDGEATIQFQNNGKLPIMSPFASKAIN